MASNSVEYIIKLTDKMSPVLKKIQGQVSKSKASLKGLKQSVDGLSGIGVGLSAAGITAFVGKSVKAFDIQEQAMAQVRQGLLSTEGAAGRTFDQLTKQASDFQKVTLFGDEEILKGVTAQLLTFTNIAGENFDRTQKAALDVTTRLFGADASAESLKSTSIQLGKALNDPAANMGALSRSGIQFSEQQKAQIKLMQKSGNLAGAQALILAELEKQYGGSAEAAAKAGAGGLKQLSNALGDVQEKIGKALLPAVNALGSVLWGLIGIVEKYPKTFKVIGIVLASVVAVIVSVVGAVKLWTVVQTVLNAVLFANPIGLMIVSITALVALITALWQNSETFRGVILGVWEVLKGVYSFIKAKVLKVFEDLREKGFKGIADDIKNVVLTRLRNLLQALKGLGKAFKALFSGEFKEAAKEAGNSISLIATNRTLAENIETGKKIGEKFKEGFAKGKLGIEGDVAGVTGGAIAPPVTGVKPTTASKTGENVVKAGGIKSFNINIQSITGVNTISTNNMTEAPREIGKQITQAILGAIADVQPA